MIRLSANKLLAASTEQLWTTLKGPFTLVFADGEILTDARETIFSSYLWDLVREFPKVQLCLRHHASAFRNDNTFAMHTDTHLLTNITKDIRELYMYDTSVAPNWREFNALMARRSHETVNHLYNEVSMRLQEYAMTLGAMDFVQTQENPAIANAIRTAPPFETGIKSVYQTVHNVLDKDEQIRENPVARVFRAKLVNANQIEQCIGVRGFITDINSSVFPKPIMRNLTNGIRRFADSFIESRSAAKSQAYAEEPLEQTEYFSRRLQLVAQIVRYLDDRDCGSQEYVHWRVKEEDLKNLVGKFYLGADGKLLAVKRGDKHLIGENIKMRSVLKCASPNPYGVCQVCFGKLSLSVFSETNLGQLCSTYLARIISQRVLSVKHLDGSSIVDMIELDEAGRRFFSTNRTGDGYYLNPALKDKQAKLLISLNEAPGFTDVRDIEVLADLNPSRVSHMYSIAFETTDKYGGVMREAVDVGLQRRPASFTTAMLEHIRKNGWGSDNEGNYVIDLAGWDYKQVLMTIPLRHFNMSDHSKEISDHLESGADYIEERDTRTSPVAYLGELFEIVNSRLSINMAVLEVVAYSTMIVSAEGEDYSLPKPWTKQGIGVMVRTMARRSLSASMAFEGHRLSLTDPLSFTLTNRPDHPMDVMITPREVIEHNNGLMHF